jgi:regulatory protein
LLEDETLQKARSRVLRWLSYRSRSRREAEQYLERKGFSGPIVNAVIAEMQEYRYIDDARFTEDYIQSCLGRGFGPNRARMDLKKRGIGRDLIADGLAKFFHPEQDLKRAISLLEKRVSGDTDCRDQKWLRRQVAFLKARGFNESVIMKAVQQFYRGPVEDETLS